MKMYTNIIDAVDLKNLMDRDLVRIVDTRFYLDDTSKGIVEYLDNHIPGALYAHLDEDLSGEIIPGKTGRHPLPEKLHFRKKVEQWGIFNDTQVVVYDHGPGGIAARLWWMMNWLGHDKIAVLNGGWKIWTEKGLPVDKVIPDFQTSAFKIHPPKVGLVQKEFIRSSLHTEAVCLVDARDERRYRGDWEPIDPVAGHIPGAVNFPFHENLNGEGLWKSKSLLKERYLDLTNDSAEGQIIMYCGSGVTACHDVLAMDYAGLERPAMYAGSWSEWITDPDAPVEM